MFTSDNFNKYPGAQELLNAMIEEKLNLPFFVQCDTQVVGQDDFIDLLGRAGCFQMFVGVESFDRKTLLSARKAQNHPALYGEIIKKCRERRIMSHFSNIVGFPQDTLQTIDEHLNILWQLDPDIASFYVLTPIPGTEQYAEFLCAGLLTEPNLDRYDTTYPTWRHPNLGAEELENALFSCYRRFYSPRHMARYLRRNGWRKNLYLSSVFSMYPLFNRYSAHMKLHPMSGGVARRKIDSAKDYLHLRRKKYGFDLAPLPSCLELSASDAALNSKAKLVTT